jgi:hypothetical protein
MHLRRLWFVAGFPRKIAAQESANTGAVYERISQQGENRQRHREARHASAVEKAMHGEETHAAV